MFEYFAGVLRSSAAESGESWFDLIIEFIKERLTVDFGEYDNLGLSGLSLERLRMTVIAAFLAIIIASFVITLNRGVYGTLIARLNAERCHSPESAKTLGELGLMKNSAVRSGLRGGSIYKGLVFCPAKDEFDTAAVRANLEARASGSQVAGRKYRYDFERDRFYIPEDVSFTAERKFEKRGSRLPVAILVSIVTAIGMFIALLLLPDILTFIDNFIGLMSQI